MEGVNMAHFARRVGNKVAEVIVIANSDCGGGTFPASEPIGQEFIADTLDLDGEWLQTSYSGSFRRQYANIGGFYISSVDEFSEAPVPKPLEDGYWEWNEAEQKWQR